MALVNSNYKGHYLLRGSHLETIYPSLTRKVSPLVYDAIEIDTPDNDFLQLDLYRNDSDKLVIISHGLEGNSRRPYMIGAARAFFNIGYNVICWNYRGCGTKSNRQPKYYHSGATYDLLTVVKYASDLPGIEHLALAGFSLGGNLTLKFLGEQGSSLPQIKSAAVISTPLDLSAGSDKLNEPQNYLYTYRFLRTLKQKALLLHQQHPGSIELNGLAKVKTLRDFDDQFTAPVHGFKGADDYYSQCSSGRFVSSVEVPTLILNAINDPFLPKESYPYDLLEPLEKVFFETPKRGGHVGFFGPDSEGVYWCDKRIAQFVNDNLL